MKTLLLLRHAKSSWNSGAETDHDRPLNDRGKRDAPRMGRLLAEQHLVPDRIISSSAKRARKTASKVAEECGFDGEIQITDDLYEAAPESHLEVLHGCARDDASQEGQRILIVAHNPTLEELSAALTGRFEQFPTAALAHIELPIESWRDLRLNRQGELKSLWRPRENPEE